VQLVGQRAPFGDRPLVALLGARGQLARLLFCKQGGLMFRLCSKQQQQRPQQQRDAAASARAAVLPRPSLLTHYSPAPARRLAAPCPCFKNVLPVFYTRIGVARNTTEITFFQANHDGYK
jgi:hypothetical protein